MRVLLDQNAPQGLQTQIPGHEVTLARQMGWHELANGNLIAAAEAGGFDVLITADQSIKYQQNLTGRRLALVVVTTNHWDTIRSNVAQVVAQVVAAVEAISPGGYVTVTLPRPLRVRRPFRP